MTDPKITDTLEDVKHSPTPWIVREVHYEGELPRILIQRFRGDGMGYETIAMPYGQSHHRHNAAFIVRAVNAHDALVEALDQIHMLVSYIKVHGVGEQPPPREDGLPQIKRASVEELGFVLDKIGELSRAALVKAGAP